MQNLRKKTSPLKYKNETSRFMGEGVSFKAKLIGILEVSEARGDRMCQEALSDLKMAIRAAGEHKQRITITIAIDGLRLRDEKTGDSLYHHPVHKISFIAQDMTDSRAFGYIFGSPDTGHRFFGIKTDKAASQVVIAMRDLFQVVFALKKKEIELAKQHLERSSPLFSDGSSTYTKQMQSLPHISIKSSTESKPEDCNTESKNSGAAVADLVDLELELNSLQQGLTQMEKMTPMDPFNSRDDPFGDSFITYPVKPILPPPPGSGRDRSSRNSDSSSVFSPKTPQLNTADSLSDRKNFSFSQDITSSHEDHSSGDWFNPSGNVSIFEEPPTLPILEPTKDEKHEKAKLEIMSQFDVFTELDPLELKNPPKKALNELTSTSSNTTQEPPPLNTGFNQNIHNSRVPIATFPTQGVFTVDPFGEDPFVREDPFADSDFSKQDPFESEFSLFASTQDTSSENLSFLKSPKTIKERLKSPIFKNNTLDITLDKSLDLVEGNKSLDIPTERDSAPEPPPRPSLATMQITPPPLPPKKMFADLSAKPPPRPPYHLDESSYDFIEKYESAPTSEIEKNPPLPLPARKAKFDVEFGSPERPKKPSKLSASQEEDYLAPITFSEQNNVILLPPPQKSTKRFSPNANMPETNVSSNGNLTDSSLDGLDITLSQLTLTSLNELAQRLHIPASQLSNMTLVQLANYLSNYIRSNSSKPVTGSNETNKNVSSSNNFDVDFPSFKADFAANFNNCNNKSEVSYDRYAVFRELMQEEIKQTKIDSEPEEILKEKVKLEASVNNSIVLDLQPLKQETVDTEDKYAALREIVENELKQCEFLKKVEPEKYNENFKSADEENHENELAVINETENDQNIDEEKRNLKSDIEIEESSETPKTTNNATLNEFSPSKEEVENKHSSPPESPVTPTITATEVSNEASAVPSNMRLPSGSLSDIVSGSSPEVDGLAKNLVAEKKGPDPTGENWAVFDQTTLLVDAGKEKLPIHSEEGISPWSSDSKEFGNGSPSELRSKDSSGPELRPKKGKGQDGWWDTSAEPGRYCSSNRRSTDSYDEEYYDCHDKPRRRRHPYNWQHGSHGAGGHSSSSRDVSPWEEEPHRGRDQRDTRHPIYRHSRCHPFDKYRERTSNDSWDEDEDDYEYEDDRRYYWAGKHSRRETERDTRQSAIRNLDGDRRVEDWNEEGRHRRRREARDRRCCPEWEQDEHDKSSRYDVRRIKQEPPSHTKWRSRKQEEKCYPRESQESPWEDEYSNDPEHIYYTTGKRTSKPRPSSASEIDRKTGEIKSKHYLQTGGSDGEWDKRHKPSRRSRSRDSQYSEPGYRYKFDPAGRNIHRSRTLSQSKPADSEFSDKKVNDFNEIYRRRKKLKDTSPKLEDNVINTFPRRSNSRGKIVPCDTFNTTEEITPKSRQYEQFNFENDFDVSEIESPTIQPTKTLRQRTMFDKQSSLVERDTKLVQRAGSLKESKLFGRSSKPMFEDDFSPSEKPDDLPEDSICSIKEETDRDENDEFEESRIPTTTNGRRLKLNKNRMLGSLCKANDLKKSQSVNIFERDEDPFDDDFFYDESAERDEEISSRNVELRWSEDFKNT